MLLKCYTQYVSKFGKFTSVHRTRKGQFSFQSQKKWKCQRMLKPLRNCAHFTCSKVMLKILQARFQQYVNGELQDV